MNDQSSWDQLEHHFHLCLAMDHAQQTHYLHELQRDTPALATEVRLLLQSDAAAETEQFCEENPFDPLYKENETGTARNHFEQMLNTPTTQIKLSPKNRLLLATVTATDF